MPVGCPDGGDIPVWSEYSLGYKLPHAGKWIITAVRVPACARRLERAARARQGAVRGRPADLGDKPVNDINEERTEALGCLPGEDTQAHRFGKAREAQATALTEDYVELIDDLVTTAGEARPTDIARRLGVAHTTAIKTIARLKRDGFATSRPYRGVFLTEQGRALAVKVRARHRLVVEVLTALGVPADVAEADAEGIEHYVSPTTLIAFAAFLERQGDVGAA